MAIELTNPQDPADLVNGLALFALAGRQLGFRWCD